MDCTLRAASAKLPGVTNVLRFFTASASAPTVHHVSPRRASVATSSLRVSTRSRYSGNARTMQPRSLKFRAASRGSSKPEPDMRTEWQVAAASGPSSTSKQLSGDNILSIAEKGRTEEPPGGAQDVGAEIQACYDLVETMGRGVVYLGSARIPQEHRFFQLAKELSREAALLLQCTSWTGVGPGLMEAVIQGAFQARQPAAGMKIVFEAGQAPSFVHASLPPQAYLVCRSIAARKLGLIHAAKRFVEVDHTAFVALPGGIGTLDEIFEILALTQLNQLGCPLPVPFLLMNYDGCFSALCQFLEDLKGFGAVSDGEVAKLCKVCDSNLEALEFLADFYKAAPKKRAEFQARLAAPAAFP